MFIQHLNSEPRPESSKRKHRTPYDELSDIFQLIGQHENTDEVSYNNRVGNRVDLFTFKITDKTKSEHLVIFIYV